MDIMLQLQKELTKLQNLKQMIWRNMYMKSQSINIKKLDPNAIIPTYGSEFAAGADLYALIEEPVEFAPAETKLIHTGIARRICRSYLC